jgi:hypothetical protein
MNKELILLSCLCIIQYGRAEDDYTFFLSAHPAMFGQYSLISALPFDKKCAHDCNPPLEHRKRNER